MSSVLAGFVGGIIAWFASNFVGAPFIEFFKLRNEIIRARLRAISAPIPLHLEPGNDTEKELAAAKDTLRTLGRDMIAYGDTTRMVTILKWIGYDPRHIGEQAMALANMLDDVIRRVEYDNALLFALGVRRG